MKHANIAIFVPHIGCPNQCSFCNQCSISGQQKAPAPQEAAQTCAQALQHMGSRAAQGQIAFFGGSFTAIEPGYMEALLQAVQPYIGPQKFSGIRISTRPDAIDHPVLRLLQKYHVTSIELGVQSMDDAVLRANFRGHTADQVVAACQKIRQYPFELGLQMMVGLQGETTVSLQKTAEAIAALYPDTLRIYPTLVIKGTKLAQWYQQGSYTPLSLEQTVAQCARLLQFFESQGIPVIRLGLHASDMLEQDLLAGPYHPALRELCESRLYLDHCLELLQQREKSKKYHILVSPTCISKMVGQGRKNILLLAQQGYNVQVKPKAGMPPFSVEIQEVQQGGSSACS